MRLSFGWMMDVMGKVPGTNAFKRAPALYVLCIHITREM
jgi:hypothetical protein